jgi:hypothetical protein
MIYKLIGMAVVKLGWMFLRRKASNNRGLLAGAGAVMGLAILAVIGGSVGYALTRETPEA